MNFLAHVFLSGNDFPLAFGNLIADQVKGNEVQNYPLQVQKGIKLHHAIDHFTDTHQIFKECVTELFPIYRHFSRVIIDMYFDHFLAVHWNKYHSLSLEEFSKKFYSQLRNYNIDFSIKINSFINALINYNWFEKYKSINGLGIMMTQMEKRTSFDSNLGGSTTELIEKYSYFEEQFLNFIRPLIAFSKMKITQL